MSLDTLFSTEAKGTLSTYGLTEEQIEIADVDNSGKVNAVDARKILRVAAKLDPPFEGLDIDKFLVEKGVLNVVVPVESGKHECGFTLLAGLFQVSTGSQ